MVAELHGLKKPRVTRSKAHLRAAVVKQMVKHPLAAREALEIYVLQHDYGVYYGNDGSFHPLWFGALHEDLRANIDPASGWFPNEDAGLSPRGPASIIDLITDDEDDSEWMN